MKQTWIIFRPLCGLIFFTALCTTVANSKRWAGSNNRVSRLALKENTIIARKLPAMSRRKKKSQKQDQNSLTPPQEELDGSRRNAQPRQLFETIDVDALNDNLSRWWNNLFAPQNSVEILPEPQSPMDGHTTDSVIKEQRKEKLVKIMKKRWGQYKVQCKTAFPAAWLWVKANITRRRARRTAAAAAAAALALRAWRRAAARGGVDGGRRLRLPGPLRRVRGAGAGAVRDLDVDAADREYKDKGRLLELQAHPVARALARAAKEDARQAGKDGPGAVGNEAEVALIYALEMQLRQGHRAAYVRELSGIMKGMSEQLTDKFVFDRVIGSNARLWEEGHLILQVRVADAALRVARDSLLQSCRDIQELLDFWREKHERSRLRAWVLRRLDLALALLPNRVHISFEELDRKEANVITTVEVYLANLMRKLGQVQRILLERPTWNTGFLPPPSLLEWAVNGIYGTQKLMDPSQHIPVRKTHYEVSSQSSSDNTPGPPQNSTSSYQDFLKPKIEERTPFVVNWLERSSMLADCACDLVTVSNGHRAVMERTIKKMGAQRPIYAKLGKHGFRLVLVPIGYKGVQKVRDNWDDIYLLAIASWEGTRSFFYDQAYKPLKEIIKTVIFRRSGSTKLLLLWQKTGKSDIFDDDALEDAQASLARLLDDFARDTQPNLPKAERERRAKEMDMSLVSPVYEKEIAQAVKNILSGRIVRMLLIQVQFIKKELLVAMQAIDELYNANQVNLQIITIIPAVLLALVLAGAARNLVYALTSQGFKSTYAVHATLRALLREIERVLTLSQQPEQPSVLEIKSPPQQSKVEDLEGYGEGKNGQEDETYSLPIETIQILTPEEQGKFLNAEETAQLILLIFRFRLALRSNYQRFPTSLRQQLEADLDDLVRGRVTVAQQLATTQRMRNSYAVFKVAASSVFKDLGFM